MFRHSRCRTRSYGRRRQPCPEPRLKSCRPLPVSGYQSPATKSNLGGFFLEPEKGVKSMLSETVEIILQKLATITPPEIEELERWYAQQKEQRS